MSGRARGKKDNWLLVKERDEEARLDAGDAILTEQSRSVATARSMERIAAREEPRAGKAPKRASRSVASPSLTGVQVTHPDRVLYPDDGLTKQDVAEYYAGIAEAILPHIANRPLSLLRCPSGIADCFFQKHLTTGLSATVKRIPIREKSGTRPYVAVETSAGLLEIGADGRPRTASLGIDGGSTGEARSPDLRSRS